MINAQNLPFRCPRAAARQSSTLLRAIFDDLYANRIAITDIDGNKYTYRELKQCSYSLASHISEKRNLQEGNKLKCIANYNPAGMNYVVTMLAGWILNCTVVPLSTSHTTEELVYYIKDSHAELVVTGDAHVSQMNDLAKLWESKHNDCSPLESLVIESKIFDDVDANSTIDASLKSHSSAEASSPSSLIVYTSGTTGFPKGVVHSDMSLHAMTASLVEAWQYTPEDKILHFLPLHHVHGIVNKLLCVLYAGGHVEFMPSANPVLIWKRLAQESAPRVGGLVPHDQKLSFFMGVPTVYARLMESADSIRSSTSTASSYPSITPAELNAGIETLRSMRLHVSGSAALPYPVMTAWEELTGHVLLERYGMTEIGWVF